MRDPQAVKRGKRLRKSMAPPEWKLQAPLGPFITDFLSHDARLVVELDGETHADSVAANHDESRTRFFEERGFRVVRFFNREVGEDLDYVVERIRLACGLAPSGTD